MEYEELDMIVSQARMVEFQEIWDKTMEQLNNDEISN
jgi:hypothetical protein